MSVTINVENYSSLNNKGQERSNLAADVAVGATTFTLRNNNNIAANDVILLGAPGSETAEIVTVASAAGATVVTTNATTLFHNKDESVRVLVGTQLKIYRASNVDGSQPADGSFASIATINIDPDQLMTSYTDAAGSASYWYKFTYYNAVGPLETSLAESAAARGGGVGNYVSLDAIRHEAGFDNNLNIGNGLIDQMRRQAQSQVNGALSGLYTIPFTAPINATIERITMILAAGFLLKDQYGSYTTNDTKNGNDKIKEAEGLLEKLKSGQLTLTDGAGAVTPTGQASGGFSGYPNSTAPDSEDFMFKRSYNFGYETRKY